MVFPLKLTLAPMEANSVATIPEGPGWQYEPKWDGFRCLAFRDGENVELRSKAGKPLGRYFPDIVAAVRGLRAQRFVLDGEIVIAAGGTLSFDALLQRIHPAAIRVNKLAAATPARLVVFDLLADGEISLINTPLEERRVRLEAFAAKNMSSASAVQLSPATTQRSVAKKWFGRVGTSLDGIMAKQIAAPYAAGERGAMVKIKPRRTADCVVGGFRYTEKAPLVGSLLLGLYGDDGRLNHVGFCSGIKDADRAALTKRLEDKRGFSGKAPGGPSRWTTKRRSEWVSLEPVFVVEVEFDHASGDRFRHGTSLLRWRPDKAPRQCKMEQLHQKSTRLISMLNRGLKK